MPHSLRSHPTVRNHTATVLWLLFTLGSVLPFTAHAQSELKLYDIEVLVFRHAGPPTLTPQPISDFTELPIPLVHPSQDVATAADPTPGMETAWRKLDNSGGYQALWFTRWRQAASSYNRPRRYRIHNDEIIRRPVFEQRDALTFDQPAEEAQPQVAPTDPAADSTLPDEPPLTLEEAFRIPFPPTEIDEQNYRLDGWLSFSRQRFFHIGMALEWRQVDPWGDSGDTLLSEDRIIQNRRIEVGRFEYFDTPGLSVLVRVQEVTPPQPESTEFDPNVPTPLEPVTGGN